LEGLDSEEKHTSRKNIMDVDLSTLQIKDNCFEHTFNIILIDENLNEIVKEYANKILTEEENWLMEDQCEWYTNINIEIIHLEMI
jgi:hypothetical protein